MMQDDIRITWCCDPKRSQELADFFARNVTPAYISHSELQGRRALAPDRWRDDLQAILRREIDLRLVGQSGVPAATGRPVVVAEKDNALVALSLVAFNANAPVPFGVIEDLIVRPDSRSHGIGAAIIEWIATEARARRIGRLFLESGVCNDRAHHAFERAGFGVCSVVMMRSL
jgi:GNAT superfamily N-acetyltransferase